MHKGKLLTVEDLIMFCENQNFAHFSSEESGYQICIQVPSVFSKDKEEDPYMLYAHVLAYHTGRNRNQSNLTVSAAKKAMKTMAYKPVLANFCEIDGVRDFTSHDIEVGEDGEYVYIEKQVGCFTADAPYMKVDPDHEDRQNIYAKVAIPREYTDAAEIIERKNGTKCSVELGVNELSYDVDNKELRLEDVEVMGLTLLGVDPDTGEEVKEGMEGAHVQIEDFSVENNSLTFNSKLINEIAEAVANRIGNDITAERRNEVVDFEEKINETTDENTVVETTEEETVVEEMSEEPVTEETPEVVEEEEVKPETDFEEEVKEETVTENFGDDDPEEDTEDDGEDGDDDDSEDEVTEEAVIDDDTLPAKRKYSVNGMEFELSLSDIQNALFDLVNSTYSESDNDCYGCEIYQDSKTVVMIGMWSGKAYKQSYKVRNGVYSLVGDRVPVRASWLTADEEAELDKMRSNYSSISDKLAKYEAELEKMQILNSEEYVQVAESADFAELKTVEKHFDMSVDEVRKAADDILLAFAKSNKLDFSKQPEKKTVGLKKFSDTKNKRPSRYGSLFKK